MDANEYLEDNPATQQATTGAEASADD